VRWSIRQGKMAVTSRERRIVKLAGFKAAARALQDAGVPCLVAGVSR
jgi:hypothetical protein